VMDNSAKFGSFAEFYAYYLAEHAHRRTRQLHFLGTSLVPLLILLAALTGLWWLCVLAVLQAYLLAWIGHFYFEHNRPATFRHPWFSLLADWRMWWDILRGHISLRAGADEVSLR
jgi:hypothetical protein